MFLYAWKVAGFLHTILANGTARDYEAGGSKAQGTAGKRLSVREVERRSERLALLKKNSEYYLSRGWLTDIENGTHVPSIFKIYSMATFYKRGWADLVALFDMHVSELRRDQARFDLPNTVLLDAPAVPDSETIALPIRPRGDLSLEQTSLLSKLVAVWGDVPIPLVQQLNLRKSLYGFIGLSDRTLSPLIPAGSFVQIDVRQRKITTRPSATAFDRAIYLSNCAEPTRAVGVS